MELSSTGSLTEASSLLYSTESTSGETLLPARLKTKTTQPLRFETFDEHREY